MSIKLSIVGTGKVARSNYLPFLSKQDEIDLTYYSRTRSKADECASEFGGRVVDSLDRLIETSPDAILVLTNERDRYRAAKDLLQRKPKRLFFEKPLVAVNGQANVREDDFFKAKEIIEDARAARSETAMVFNYRFFEQTVRLKKMVGERDLGPLINATLFVNYACWSHCIDLLHQFGGGASQISALSGGVGPDDAEDVAGSFRLVNGATGTILGTSRYSFAFPLYDNIFNFQNGLVRFGDLDGEMAIYENGSRYIERHALIGHHSRWDQYAASFEKSLAAYVESIRKNEPPPVPGIAGLRELQFEASLQRSIAERRPVNVDDEFPIEQ